MVKGEKLNTPIGLAEGKTRELVGKGKGAATVDGKALQAPKIPKDKSFESKRTEELERKA